MMLDEDGYVFECDWCGLTRDHTHSPTCSIYNYRSHSCNCGAWTASNHEDEIRVKLWPELFRLPGGRSVEISLIGVPIPRGLPHEFPADTCRQCSIELAPLVQKFAEIYQIHILNQRLKGTIYDYQRENRRTQDHRTTSHNAGECSQGSHAGAA